MNLRNSGAIVVGGGSGLGEATARHIVASGGHCIIVDLDEAKGRVIAEQLGSDACFVRGDMTQTADIERALDAGGGRALRLAVITAMLATGLPVLDRNGAPHDLERFRRGMEVNVSGTFNVLRLAAARMARQPALENGQRGVIVMTSSIAAFEGQSSQRYGVCVTPCSAAVSSSAPATAG